MVRLNKPTRCGPARRGRLAGALLLVAGVGAGVGAGALGVTDPASAQIIIGGRQNVIVNQDVLDSLGAAPGLPYLPDPSTTDRRSRAGTRAAEPPGLARGDVPRSRLYALPG